MTNPRSLTVSLVLALLLGACGGGQETIRSSQTKEPRARPVDDAVRKSRPASAATSSGTESGAGSGTAFDSFGIYRAMRHVNKLARDIGVRVRATSGERLGARYIARKFRSFGYDVSVRTFDVDGGTSRNVVASWPGSIRYPIVVGGHMDTVEDSPGANDNASGVAVVLETARLAAGTRQAHFVKFVAFGSEEYGRNGLHHVGSQVFVDRLGSRGRRRLPAMLSVDMIADGRPLIVGTAGIGPEVLARDIHRRLNRADIDTVYRTTCDCSDNGPFERAGIPASFMWSGDEPNYHDSSDTVPNMKREDLLRTGRAVRLFVQALGRDDVDRYRRY